MVCCRKGVFDIDRTSDEWLVEGVEVEVGEDEEVLEEHALQAISNLTGLIKLKCLCLNDTLGLMWQQYVCTEIYIH